MPSTKYGRAYPQSGCDVQQTHQVWLFLKNGQGRTLIRRYGTLRQHYWNRTEDMAGYCQRSVKIKPTSWLSRINYPSSIQTDVSAGWVDEE